MAVTAATLRTLHRIHQQLTELLGRLDRGPKQVAAHERNVAAREADLAAAREAVKQAQLQADRKQLDLKASEQRIVDWQAKLNAASSNKEYQTLQEQIAAAEMANSVLADEILEQLEKVDQLGEGVAAARAAVAAAEGERDKVKQKVESESSLIKADIERLQTDLKETEKQLPGEVRADYNRVIKAKGADGMADVEDGVCTGCGQQITPNAQNSLLLNRPTFCTACGRLLYMPE